MSPPPPRRSAAAVGAWLAILGRALGPHAGTALPPIRGVRSPLLAWAPHLVVTLGAVVLGAVAAGRLHEAHPDAPALSMAALGLLQGLPLVLALVRPLAGFWTSVVIGAVVSEIVRVGASAQVWAEPSLLAHLGVLALVGFRVRASVLVVLWLVTLLAGAALVQRMPGMNASGDLAEMTTLSAVVLVAAGALGGRATALRRLADQERLNEAERTRRSVLEERARIARELHDVVAHHMSLIAIQAEAAPYRVPDAPPELARSMHTIRTSAVQAMDELRRILGVLREPGSDVPAPLRPTAPQPTLAGVDELVSTVAGAGQPVTLTVHGSARPLPPGLDLTAYRIVQEALSNATRHAPGAATNVTIDHRPDALAVSVVNDPAPNGASAPPAAGSGHGLLGMRERVAMLAGVLDAGPRPDGGYAVVAVLPTDRDGNQ